MQSEGKSQLPNIPDSGTFDTINRVDRGSIRKIPNKKTPLSKPGGVLADFATYLKLTYLPFFHCLA
jgi:hypothetical protein